MKDLATLDRIAERAHYLATMMIHQANIRKDKEKGDPKIGGHQSASASSLHILGALHLFIKTGFDHIAVKPHASPTDHAYNYLLNLLLHKSNLERFSLDDANTAMHGLRKFSQNGEPVFQSYHSKFDPDHHGYLPSGTVGIPPVNLGYLALAYRFAEEHGYEIPKGAHFWALIGDSEFREGSLHEAIPDFSERELHNLTWIIDYNRQSLDGHRITNKRVMGGTDNERIERLAMANGWDVIQVRHGKTRSELFRRPGGDVFKNFLEQELEDYEFQALLLVNDAEIVRTDLLKHQPKLKTFLEGVKDAELLEALRDLGGHDFEPLIEAMNQAKNSKRKPTMIIVHTLKGWGLRMAAACGNHSSLASEEEVSALKKANGGKEDGPDFFGFASGTPEDKYLKTRGDKLYSEIKAQHALKEKNHEFFLKESTKHGAIPAEMGINLKMVNYPHTQWMLGQLTAKLTRLSNTGWDSKEKPITPEEKPFKLPGELLISMAPDVGTSTNLNPAMDGKIFGAIETEDFETDFGVKDNKLPDLIPGEEVSDRFLRFDIAEGNVMSCVGSFGHMRDLLGIPLIPLMTVYDFFIKRALDQYFYNLYWNSSFILVGTPSGITLSPEGAQHGWKSDIQIPNQIVWEPFFCLELDWILTDAIRRHLSGDNVGRTGVTIRGVTRGVDQKLFLSNLKKQTRFKTDPSQALAIASSTTGGTDESAIAAIPDGEILNVIREETLRGAYYLIDYRGYAGYEPGDNVVQIFAMGSLVTEALDASTKLLAKGIYANVIVVTSPDLLVGNLAHENDFTYLKKELGVTGDLFLNPMLNGTTSAADMKTVAGRRVPIVSVHDGEPGLLDNIGSIVGVKHESLAVRKHSKCGRPRDVYQYHHIDGDSIVDAAGKILAETALETVHVSTRILSDVQSSTNEGRWSDLWPKGGHV